MIKKSFFIFIVMSFFAGITQAMELRGYCFDSNVNLMAVKQHLGPILKRGEVVDTRSSLNCVELQLSDEREELFSKWIRQRFKVTRTYIGRNEQSPAAVAYPTKNCRFEVERKTSGESQTRKFRVGKDGVARQVDVQEEGGSRTRMLVGAGSKSKIRMDDEIIELICYPQGTNHYKIDFFINTPKGQLSTVVLTKTGETLNLGSIVDDVKRRHSTVGISGVDYEKEKRDRTHNYFMKVQ